MVKWLCAVIVLISVSLLAQAPYLQHRRTVSRPPPAAGGGGGSNVTLDTSAKGTPGSVVTSCTVAITVANNANRVLIIAVGRGDGEPGGDTVSSVSSSLDGALTHVGSSDSSDNNYCRTEFWRLIAPTAGSHTITVNFSGNVDIAIAMAISLYGVDQTTPIGTPTAVNGTVASTAPTGAVTLGSDDMAVGFISTDSESLSVTTGTSRQLETNVSSDMSFGLASNTGTGSISITYSQASNLYALTVLPVNGAP